MAVSRAEAEKELLKLLNRALSTVPFVRLDKVDEVTEKFKTACDLLEENLNEDVDLSAEEDDGADENILIPRSVPATDPDHNSDEEDAEERKEKEKLEREREEEKKREEELKRKEAIRPVANKADPVRKDYSSPDIKSRGLRGSVSEAGPAKTSSRATTVTTGAVLAAAAKPSSRARSSKSPERDVTSPEKPMGKPLPQSSVGLKGASSRAAPAKSGVLRDALLRSASTRTQNDGDVQISKERYTKDDGTPRLGARKLRAAAQGAKTQPPEVPKGDANTAVLARDPVPDGAETGGSDADHSIAKKPSSRAGNSSLLPAASSMPDKSPTSPLSPSIKSGKPGPADLIPSKAKSNVSRIEQNLEAPPSPAQFNSHRHLLKIAKKQTEPASPSKLGSVAGTEEVIAITERPTESPKPAFLRRLDSPLTNHGKLLQHKARLNKMIRRAIRAVPHMKFDNYTLIKHNFIDALELLESSTTTATVKKDL